MIDFEIKQNVFYKLNVDDLEQIYDLMLEKDLILGVGYFNDIHVYYSYGKHYAIFYEYNKNTKHQEYKTKRGILNRIRKHLANGDIEHKFQLWGGRDDN